MKLTTIEVNHMIKPLGFDFNNSLHIVGFLDQGTDQKLERKLVIKNNGKTIYQTNWEAANDLIYDISLILKPRTKYYVIMSVKNKEKIVNKETWFETAFINENLKGNWIGTNFHKLHSVIFSKKFSVEKANNARLYISALGLYEVYIDNKKVGDEYLTPGFTNYFRNIQIQTYDVTDFLSSGNHVISILVGDGWYKGKLGLKTHGGQPNNYGADLFAIADLIITNKNGEQIVTTDESWKVIKSPITDSGIYYGEDYDDTISPKVLESAHLSQKTKGVLNDRLSLPVKKHEVFKVKKIIHTPNNSTVLDFGQNIAGWVEFKNNLPQGQKVTLEYGEILQDEEFYRDNLRSARAKFTYKSNGKSKWVRPHFTYFGFRYVKLDNFTKEINPDDFKAFALYSNMEETGNIKTDNKKVNRLFENIKWGQKSNFIDIPTDCPQRDERLGWTGDAAIFAETASYNMETYAFFKKFAKDIAIEQDEQEGKVPLYVPRVDTDDGGKAVWSDAATIIPWISYQRSQDKSILKQNFSQMKSWVDWIHKRAKKAGNEFLWLGDDQLGDWLALDTEDILKLKGKTADDLNASAFYYYSSFIVKNAAKVLYFKKEEEKYGQLANSIKTAFIKHFYTGDGLTVADTQTGLALCLKFHLYPENAKQKVIDLLVEKIEKKQNHLDTGFVGTPILLPALSENNQKNLALRIFLQTDYPSWLFEVDHGATTIWERWNSLDDQGKIAENGMNSLNHYSNGSVMAWAYEYLLGLKQSGSNVEFGPAISTKFHTVSGQIKLPTGLVKVNWKIKDAFHVAFNVHIPYGSKMMLKFSNVKELIVNDKHGQYTLPSGEYHIYLTVKKPIVEFFDVHTPISEFLDNKNLTSKISKLVPFWDFLTLPGNMKNFAKYSLYQLSKEMKGIGFRPFNEQEVEKINDLFKQTAILGVKNE